MRKADELEKLHGTFEMNDHACFSTTAEEVVQSVHEWLLHVVKTHKLSVPEASLLQQIIDLKVFMKFTDGAMMAAAHNDGNDMSRAKLSLILELKTKLAALEQI